MDLAVLKGVYRRNRHRYVSITRGDVAAARALGVTIGECCRILSSNFGTEPWLIEIGDRVTVSGDVHFLTHDGGGWLIRDERGRRYRYAPIKVGDDVFVGAASVIMPGVRIGDRCIIGAGSVVTKSVPTGSIVAGVPARIIGDFDDYEKRALTEWVADDEMAGDLREATRRHAQGFLPDMT